MAYSLLAHLYSRIRGSQEDVATISLQYLLSQSEQLNRAFTRYIASKMEVQLDSSLQYVCQATGEDGERPDMVGIDRTGREVILCEMKFYAALTANQPAGYLKRLKDHGGTGLVFICPKSRQTNLWTKLKKLCDSSSISTINPHCICVDGMRLSILTWGEVIEQLHITASSSAEEYLSDIKQLRGYCDQMDSDAFIPFSPEDLSAENAKKGERFYEIIDETVELLCGDNRYTTSRKGLKATAYRKGYTKSLYLDDFVITLNYDRDFWKNDRSVETPFWVAIRTKDWETPESFENVLSKIPSDRKENTWYATFLALDPMTDATLDELCEDLKSQIFKYLHLFPGSPIGSLCEEAVSEAD